MFRVHRTDSVLVTLNHYQLTNIRYKIIRKFLEKSEAIIPMLPSSGRGLSFEADSRRSTIFDQHCKKQGLEYQQICGVSASDYDQISFKIFDDKVQYLILHWAGFKLLVFISLSQKLT